MEPDPTITDDRNGLNRKTSDVQLQYNNHNNPLVDPFDKRNPFENASVKTYSHNANIIPPYVLDKLSQVHYKEQLVNSNTNNVSSEASNIVHSDTVSPLIKSTVRHSRASSNSDDDKQYQSFANDAFIKSMGNNWHNFLHTVQQPNTYTPDMMAYDQKFNADWDLNGTWGGEERLKNALLGSPLSGDEDSSDTYERKSWFSRMFSKTSNSKTQQKSSKLNSELHEPRVRSKAGYWMSDEKRADWKPTIKRIFMQNPLIPLFLRVLIIICSALSLALACSIFVLSRNRQNPVQQQPSTIMAIIVECFAVAYVSYISYDEYHGKPLGLRDPVEKMQLILLDLLFIIFSSANISLTYNTLYDPEWVCKEFDNSATTTRLYPTIGSICRRQRALSSFLFLALCLWVITFTISILRVVDKVTSANPRSD
ncbi:regulator of phospholipase D Srf1p [[Candida] railenensis]|uniref:Regulator of phospholipase D Srf1p n=1 Tax=[Candida] railenensis TaxID=45579 RepID=A0A9P0W0Z1_9ASCO|nr:regulator of phospholipase D Srf1p [[Candida] railenensis]